MNKVAPPDDRFRFAGHGLSMTRHCIKCDKNKTQHGGQSFKRWGSHFWCCRDCREAKEKRED